ncbi:hypothetical protein ACFXC9_07930 [Streptomyces naganishii]|uniref:hypothetical protein n=1 Tax=Streptomyces naganishii TaxID=285447 RepID=UPI003675D06D
MKTRATTSAGTPPPPRSWRAAGRSLDPGSRARRPAREGLFLLVRGQTAEVRRFHLGRPAG